MNRSARMPGRGSTPTNDSAKLIRDWIDHETFVWLIDADIVNEAASVAHASPRVR